MTTRPDFVINLSANTVEQADRFKRLGIAPVTLVLPEEAGSSFKTAGGNQVVICPASIIKGMTCLDCQLCLKLDRQSIIGFPAHGSGKHRLKVW